MKEESKIRTISLTDPTFKIIAWVIALLCVSLVILYNYEYLSSLTWAKFSADSIIFGLKVSAVTIFLFTCGLLTGEIKIKRSSRWYLIRFVLDTPKDPNEPEHYLA